VRLHLCRELLPGVPLPASLTVYRPRIPLAPRADRTLVEQLAAVIEPASGSDDATIDLPSGTVMRRVREVQAEADSAEAGVDTLRVDYWLVPPSRRPLLLSFTCGLVGLRQELVELFDLVIRTLAFPVDQGGPRR
jgi:hypothetical protein